LSADFEIGAPGVDVQAVMREVRARIADKKARGLYTDAELREIAGRRLPPVVDGQDIGIGMLRELLSPDARWNFRFGTDSVYRSSRGVVGRALEGIRSLLKPVQKLFWNPNPMIDALSRQSDLNRAYAHLLHNLTLEVTHLNLEAQDLRNRVLQLQGRLETETRRERTLEGMVVYRSPPE
jgi:hypothetical protein